MDNEPDEAAARVSTLLEHEMSLVRGAILMVAGGWSPKVIVGGLTFGEALLSPGHVLATEAGVRLVPLWTADDAGADIAIEQIHDDR